MYNAARLHPLAAALVLAATATACQTKALPEKEGTATTANPPTVTAEQKDLVQRQHLEMTRMQLIDDRCHWLEPTTRTALDATVAERGAWLQDTQTPLITDAAAVAVNQKQADATDCKNGNDRYAVQFGAWQMRVTWTLRAHALLDGGQRPEWFSTQSPTLEFRPALEETHAALMAKYGVSIAQGQPDIEQQAEQMLALLCPKQPHNCPASASAQQGKAYALIWVQQATRVAAALAADPVKLPEPPQET